MFKRKLSATDRARTKCAHADCDRPPVQLEQRGAAFYAYCARHGRTLSCSWEYRPGAFDIADPTVIKGEPIKSGARVRIAREYNPPMFNTKVFAMIEDEHGNVQSVFRRGIARPGGAK